MATGAEMLDFSTVSGRSEKFRFDLLDRDNTVIGALHPTKVGTISNQTGGGIKRSLDNFELLPEDQAEVNTLRYRVRPWHVLGSGDEYPLGIFRWADESLVRFSYGLHSKGTLVDLGSLMDQPLQKFTGFYAGTRVVDCVATLAAAAGITDTAIASDGTTLGTDLYWPPGDQMSYGQVASELLALAPLYDWYLSNTGQFTVRAQENVSTAEATLIYNSNTRIVYGSMIESNNIIGAYNRYIALDNSATQGVVLAVYDIPDVAENSYANTGVYVPKFIQMPGVGDTYTAYLAAKSAYEQDRTTFKTVDFDSTVDSRHDTFDVVEYLEENYLEVGWRMPLEVGASMSHQIRKVVPAS